MALNIDKTGHFLDPPTQLFADVINGWSPRILDIYSCRNFWNIVMAFKCMITTKTMIRFTSWICLVCTPLKLFCWYNGFKLILIEHSYFIRMLLQKFILPIDCCAVATFAGSTAGPAVAIEGSMINFYSYIYGIYSLFLLIYVVRLIS